MVVNTRFKSAFMQKQSQTKHCLVYLHSDRIKCSGCAKTAMAALQNAVETSGIAHGLVEMVAVERGVAYVR